MGRRGRHCPAAAWSGGLLLHSPGGAGALPAGFTAFSLRGERPSSPGGRWPGQDSLLAVLQADCGSPVWSARGSSFDAVYCSEMAHGKPDPPAAAAAGDGRGAAPLPAALGEGGPGPCCKALPLPPRPPPQGMPPSRAAPCPASTASPASWTACPRRRSRGCPSATPTPSRPAPASTRGRGRLGRRRPDGPTRRYEGPGEAGIPCFPSPPGPPPPPSRLLQTLHGRERLTGPPPPSEAGGKAPRRAPASPGADRHRGSGHTHHPGNPAANKTCCTRGVWPAGFLSAFPGIGEGSETQRRGGHQQLWSASAQTWSPLGDLTRHRVPGLEHVASYWARRWEVVSPVRSEEYSDRAHGGTKMQVKFSLHSFQAKGRVSFGFWRVELFHSCLPLFFPFPPSPPAPKALLLSMSKKTTHVLQDLALKLHGDSSL